LKIISDGFIAILGSDIDIASSVLILLEILSSFKEDRFLKDLNSIAGKGIMLFS
jgi:hypothetical protein